MCIIHFFKPIKKGFLNWYSTLLLLFIQVQCIPETQLLRSMQHRQANGCTGCNHPYLGYEQTIDIVVQASKATYWS